MGGLHLGDGGRDSTDYLSLEAISECTGLSKLWKLFLGFNAETILADK